MSCTWHSVPLSPSILQQPLYTCTIGDQTIIIILSRLVYATCDKFGQLLQINVTKIAAARCRISSLYCTKFSLSWDSAETPLEGMCSPFQIPGLIFGEEVWYWKDKWWKGKRKGREWKVRTGKGEEERLWEKWMIQKVALGMSQDRLMRRTMSLFALILVRVAEWQQFLY